MNLRIAAVWVELFIAIRSRAITKAAGFPFDVVYLCRLYKARLFVSEAQLLQHRNV